jgi:hypothetical protein
MRLTFIVATRGRPDKFGPTIANTLTKLRDPGSRILLCADADDQPTLDRLYDLPKDDRVVISVKDREDSRGEKYDRALTVAPADLYIPGHDCQAIETEGFDRLFIDRAKLFPDGIGVVRSPFVFRGTFPPAVQCLTAKFVEKVGYIYNHDYPFWFIDHEVHDLARMICRYFSVDVSVPADGPSRPANTIRMRDVAFWATYYDLMALERRNKARAIINGSDFLTPEWLKEELRVSYRWIEDDARQINENVRQNAAVIEARRGSDSPPDEGYLRAKARAEQKLSAFLQGLKAAA